MIAELIGLFGHRGGRLAGRAPRRGVRQRLRLIGGQVRPQGGELLFDGQSIPALDRDGLYGMRRRILLSPKRVPCTPPPFGAPPPMPGNRESRTGLTLRHEGSRLVVVNVLAGTAGWEAGVNAGDELVALDGFRIPSPDWLNARLLEFKPGVQVGLTVFRRDELLTLPLRVDAGPPQRMVLRPVPDATEQQQAVLAHWLRQVVPDEAVQDPGLPPPPGWEAPAIPGPARG